MSNQILISIICGLVILWAFEIRFHQLFRMSEELKMHILNLKTQLDEIKIKFR